MTYIYTHIHIYTRVYIYIYIHAYTSLEYSKQTASYETDTVDQLIDKDKPILFGTVRKIREYPAARVAA